MTVYPPVGILSMSSCLKNSGARVNFIDADVLHLEPYQVVEILRQDIPQLIGISLNVSQVSHSVSYLKEIQSTFPEIPIVVGGPYVTGVREKIFRDFPSLNYAVVNEGEYAIVDFVGHLKNEKKIEDVRNLIYAQNGAVASNTIERISDLNILPLPDYSLVTDTISLYDGAYPTIASPSVAIMCTRGCPYDCTFCSSPSNWERRITFRSTDSIINEILYLKDTLGIREIFFQDDTMNARPSWFFELCEKIIANNLHKDMFFKCPFRVNSQILTEEILKKAREANFWMIFYGVENGNQEMLNRMNKHITINEIQRAFKLTRKVGLSSYASFMIGNYGETQRTVRNSIKLMKKIMPDFGGFAIAAPFPGSLLHSIAIEKKLVTMPDFTKYQFGDCILRTETLSTKDIESLAIDANRQMQKMKTSLRYRFVNRKNPFRDIMGYGFYEKELWNYPVRRTGKKVLSFVPYVASAQSIVIEHLADYPDIEKKPVKMILWVNQEKHVINLNKPEWRVTKLPIINKSNSTFVRIKWEVSRTWCPHKYGINNDNREIGVTIKRISLE
jgi:radical SAM superfamily enzyme YgiQ (UPF0313 family)